MKSKWFVIKKKAKEFKSKREAKTKKEAWDKTLENWTLQMDGFLAESNHLCCGWCNYVALKLGGNLYRLNNCRKWCDIIGDEGTCVPFRDPDLEYLYLLFVKEATT